MVDVLFPFASVVVVVVWVVPSAFFDVSVVVVEPSGLVVLLVVLEVLSDGVFADGRQEVTPLTVPTPYPGGHGEELSDVSVGVEQDPPFVVYVKSQ